MDGDVKVGKEQYPPQLFRDDDLVCTEQDVPSEGCGEAEGDWPRARGRGEADCRDGDAACGGGREGEKRLRSKKLVQKCRFLISARKSTFGGP